MAHREGWLLDGCQEGKHTPKLTEVCCPACGEIMEVFIAMGGEAAMTGATVTDEACPACGHVIPVGTKLTDLKQA